jgi:hypothetical protein
MLLQVESSLGAPVIESAFARLLTQHDALRLRFARTATVGNEDCRSVNGRAVRDD